MNPHIIVVSGLPRSGTSLMMQMLAAAGVQVLTDHRRAADVDNPRGYYEFEKVKKIKDDASWLPEARGKALKMVSQLLYHLPPSERYRVILMQRDLDEMLTSQEKMLRRLGRDAAPRDKIKGACALHLKRLQRWLERQRHVELLHVSYNDLVQWPEREAQRVRGFLGGALDAEKMATVIDPSLYRNRDERGSESRLPAGRASS